MVTVMIRNYLLGLLCLVSIDAISPHDTTVTAEDALSSPLVIKDLVVTLVDSVEIPAEVTGKLATLRVREGDSVQRGQLLASLDNRQALLEQSLAEAQLNTSKFATSEQRDVELATKRLDEQRLLAKHHAIQLDMAKEQAANKVRVDASVKTEEVALNELERAMRARQEYVDSVSKSEIDGLRLNYERTRLETKQANFERHLDELRAKAEVEVARGHDVSTERWEIEVDQAVATQRVAEMEIRLQEHETALAALVVDKHELKSPLDGVVVELLHHPGDWVMAGETVARVIRLNRLRAEGFASLDRLKELKNANQVQLTIHTGGGDSITRAGEIVFVSPEVNPVNREVAFWVEFENTQTDVLPGMRLDVECLISDAQP